MHPFIEQVYSANSEVVLKSLIEEFKEAKEAQAGQERAELLVSANQVRGDSSSASLSSSSSSSTSKASAAAATLTAGEFVDLASSDTIIVRQDGDEGEDEEGEEDRAWGTMVVNAEEEADGQFRRMFAPQKEAAKAATAAAEKREKEDELEKAERTANKKKEKRKKRANDTSASKKRKSVEGEDGLLRRREQAAAVHEASVEADSEEEEWEKPISSDGNLLRHSFADAFDVETRDAPTKKQKKTKKTSRSAATTARSKGLKKLRKEQRKEQARESEVWRKEEEAERATERQQAMLEESLALDKQLAQIDAILDSIRGAANDQSAPSLDAPTPMKMSVDQSPRRKSKIEVRMEKMRSELLAQRKAVPVPFVSAHPASPAPSLASSISSSATVAPVLTTTTTLASLVDQPHRLATSAPPALSRRERGQKRYAHEAATASTATRKKQPKAKRPRLEGTELCQGGLLEE
jgi:hypothetical protein